MDDHPAPPDLMDILEQFADNPLDCGIPLVAADAADENPPDADWRGCGALWRWYWQEVPGLVERINQGEIPEDAPEWRIGFPGHSGDLVWTAACRWLNGPDGRPPLYAGPVGDLHRILAVVEMEACGFIERQGVIQRLRASVLTKDIWIRRISTQWDFHYWPGLSLSEIALFVACTYQFYHGKDGHEMEDLRVLGTNDPRRTDIPWVEKVPILNRLLWREFSDFCKRDCAEFPDSPFGNVTEEAGVSLVSLLHPRGAAQNPLTGAVPGAQEEAGGANLSASPSPGAD